MTLSSHETNVLSCVEVESLLDAEILGESLLPADEARLRLHLSQCDSCADFRDLACNLSSFAPVPSQQMLDRTVEAATLHYFGSEKRGSGASFNHRWGWVAVAALLTAVVGIGIYFSFSPEEQETSVASICESAAPVEVVPGVWMSHCTPTAPGVDIDKNGELKITVREGIVGISADPDRTSKHGITIQTVHGEVHVLGTVFTVQKEENDSRVDVYRGEVSVWPSSSSSEKFTVQQGMGAWFSTQAMIVLPKQPTHSLAQRVLAVVYTEEDTSDAVAPQSESVSPDASKEPPHRVERSAKQHRGNKTDRNTVSIASLDVLLGQARNCLISKDWECAAERYRTILKHYDNRWESSSAYISLANIELKHFGKPAMARKHYAAYQKRYPRGALIEEAMFGMAECEHRLGNAADELRVLQSFVAKHPDSALAAKANKRIGELQNR